MDSLFADLCSFFWAIGKRWIELVTGGIVAFAWLIYCQQTGRDVPVKTFYWILAIGLFFAAFGAWREQVQKLRDTIGLRPDIGLMGDAENEHGSCIILFLTIRNTGNPTIVQDLTADIKWSGGKRTGVWPHDFGADNTFRSGGKSTSLKPEDIIYNKVQTPIPTGGFVQGYAQYRLPGVSRKQLWEGEGYEITIHIKDAWDNAFKVTRKWVNPKESENRRVMIPGTSNPFADFMGDKTPTPPSSTPGRGASPP